MPVCRTRSRVPIVASLLFGLMIPGTAIAAMNQWASGGGGVFVRALALDPGTSTTVFAGGQFAGIFRSMDAGGSWTAVNTGLTDPNVFALAVDPLTPTTLYAGTMNAGVFKSADGGDSWTAASVGLTTLSILALAVDPATPSTVYAGSDGGGVFKSVDAGGTWSPANVGLNAPTVNALAVDPAMPATLYAGTTGGGIFKSTDGAATWGVTSTAWTVWTLAIDPQTPTTIYAGMYAVGVFKSLDGGQSWTEMNQGLTIPTVRSLAVAPTEPALVAAATPGGGVFLSRDGGASWATFNDGLSNQTTTAAVIDTESPIVLHTGTLGGGTFDYELNACDDDGTPVVCSACEVCQPSFGCSADVWDTCHDPILPHKAKLHIKDKSPDARDRIVWKWLRGQATSIDQYGDPLDSTDYNLCIFDMSGVRPGVALHATVPAGGECGPKPCWREVGGRRYKYRNGEATPDGLSKLLLNQGDDEVAKIILKGHGDLLNVPSLPLHLPFLLQLQASNGQCWEALYTEHGSITNNDQLYVGASEL